MEPEEKMRMEYTVTDRRPPCTGRSLMAGVENEVRMGTSERTGSDSLTRDKQKGDSSGSASCRH